MLYNYDKCILNEGAEAYRQGQQSDDNPYDDNESYYAWLEGYRTEKEFWENQL